jgi:hypothetical protein
VNGKPEDLKFNPDVFTPARLESSASDEALVREASEYLRSVALPNMVG